MKPNFSPGFLHIHSLLCIIVHMNRTVSRRLALRNLLSHQTISSQARLAGLLKSRGFDVTQATVSVKKPLTALAPLPPR